MSPTFWLITYCLLILLASIGGGLIPVYIRLTHRRMELILSFVSGVMLGIGLLHLLPHAWAERAKALASDSATPGYSPTDIHSLVETAHHVLECLGKQVAAGLSLKCSEIGHARADDGYRAAQLAYPGGRCHGSLLIGGWLEID